MLNRNPLKRPTLPRVLSHPFFSGAKVSRMVGEKAQFDVFVSPATRITWRCLPTYYAREVCVSSGTASASSPESSGTRKASVRAWLVATPSFVYNRKLSADSKCDNVFVEHRLALELKELGHVLRRTCSLLLLGRYACQCWRMWL